MPRLIHLSVTLAVVFGPRPSFASKPTACSRALGVVERVFAWPPVADEMLIALRRTAREPNLRECVRTALDDALARAEPDFVLRVLLRPARRPTNGTPDFCGVREIVAASVAEIRDETLQLRWMEYFDHDPASTVRVTVRRAFLRWPDQARRDRYVTEPNLGETERALRLLAAKSGLGRLSPPVRWSVIKSLVEKLDQADGDVAAALGTFDDPALLCKWHADTVRGRVVLRAIRETPISSSAGGDHPRYRAQGAGYALNRIVQTRTRVTTINAVSELAAGSGERARFARAVLGWESIWSLIHHEAYDQTIGFTHDEAGALAALRARAFDERGFELARVARARLLARGHQPLATWRDEDLAAFEARLGAAVPAAD